MKPEKSNLIKISLCALSCVFFGCGKSENGNKTSETTIEQPDDNGKKDYAPLADALAKIIAGNPELTQQANHLKGLIVNGEITNVDEFNNASATFVEAVQKRFFDQIDFSKEMEEARSSIKDVGEKKTKDDKLVDKVVGAFAKMYKFICQMEENPTAFLSMAGKGTIVHESTLYAICIGWNNFLSVLKKSYDNGCYLYGRIADVEKYPYLAELKIKVDNFIQNVGGCQKNVLLRCFSEVGNTLIPNGKINFYDLLGGDDLINQSSKLSNAELHNWSRFLANRGIGVKSNRSEFGYPYSDLNGTAAQKFNKEGCHVYESGLWQKFEEFYDEVGEQFVTKGLTCIVGFGGNKDVKNVYKELKEQKDGFALSLWGMNAFMTHGSSACGTIGVSFEIFKDGDVNKVRIQDWKEKKKNIIEKFKNELSLDEKGAVLTILGLYRTYNDKALDASIRDFYKCVCKDTLDERLQFWKDYKTNGKIAVKKSAKKEK